MPYQCITTDYMKILLALMQLVPNNIVQVKDDITLKTVAQPGFIQGGVQEKNLYMYYFSVISWV